MWMYKKVQINDSIDKEKAVREEKGRIRDERYSSSFTDFRIVERVSEKRDRSHKKNITILETLIYQGAGFFGAFVLI